MPLSPRRTRRARPGRCRCGHPCARCLSPAASALLPSAPLPSASLSRSPLPTARSAGAGAEPGRAPAGAPLPAASPGPRRVLAARISGSCLQNEPEPSAISCSMAGVAICQPHRRGNRRGALLKYLQRSLGTHPVFPAFPIGSADGAEAPSGLRTVQGWRPSDQSFMIAPRRFTPAVLSQSPTLEQLRGSGC